MLAPSTPLAMLALRAARGSAPLRGGLRPGFDFRCARQSAERRSAPEEWPFPSLTRGIKGWRVGRLILATTAGRRARRGGLTRATQEGRKHEAFHLAKLVGEGAVIDRPRLWPPLRTVSALQAGCPVDAAVTAWIGQHIDHSAFPFSGAHTAPKNLWTGDPLARPPFGAVRASQGRFRPLSWLPYRMAGPSTPERSGAGAAGRFAPRCQPVDVPGGAAPACG